MWKTQEAGLSVIDNIMKHNYGGEALLRTSLQYAGGKPKGKEGKKQNQSHGYQQRKSCKLDSGRGGGVSSLTSLSFTFFFSTSLLLPKSCRARAYAPAFFDGCNSRNLPALEDSVFIYLSGKEKTKKEKKDNE